MTKYRAANGDTANSVTLLYAFMLKFCKTFVARNATQLVRRLNDVETIGSSSHTLLFSISPSATVSETDLGSIVSVFSRHPRSVGCLSAPIQTGRGAGATSIPTVCSIAAFDARNATPFRSIVPGKEPTQVGRWHAFRKKDSLPPQLEIPKDSTGIDWESVWANSQNEGTSSSVPDLDGRK